jgi:DNA polymerase-3 subunit alpha
MDDLKNLTPLQNMDLTMGGIVVSVRDTYTKKGNPCGFAKVEDYSGAYEFAFFGSDWVEKKTYFSPGMFLFIKGKCQPKQWRQDEFEVKINSIELLPEIKDKVIEKLTVAIPLSAIDDEIIEEFSTLVKESPGNADLCFYILDETGKGLGVRSKKYKITVNKKIVSFLDNQSLLTYKIN